MSVDPKRRMVVVEGVSMATKHKKPRRMGEMGGIVKQETPDIRKQGYERMQQMRLSLKSRT